MVDLSVSEAVVLASAVAAKEAGPTEAVKLVDMMLRQAREISCAAKEEGDAQE